MTETQDYDKSADPTAHALSHEYGQLDQLDISELVAISAFFAYLSSDLSVVTNTYILVTCTAQTFDRNNDYDTGTGIFTCPFDGIYFIIANALMDSLPDGTLLRLVVKLNTDTIFSSRITAGATNSLSTLISTLAECSANDTISIKIYHEGGSNKTIKSGQSNTFFSAFLLCKT